MLFAKNVHTSKQVPQSAPAATDTIKETTTAAFARDVIQMSKTVPVLVDFWAPWCQPCKQLTPILEKVIASFSGRLRLVKMNIDQHPAIAGQLGIQSIPAVIAFVDGQPVDGLIGAQPESDIVKFCQKLVGEGANDQVESVLDLAKMNLEKGQLLDALELYSQILQKFPENIHAIVGMASCYVKSGELSQAKAIIGRIPEKARNDPSVAAINAEIALAEQLESLASPAELVNRVEKNGQDFEARFDLALILHAQGQRAQAAEELLAIMAYDRHWNDDSARKRLLEFFTAWGATDPATIAARRRLSAFLFS